MPAVSGTISYDHTTSSARSRQHRAWRYAVTSTHLRQSGPSANLVLPILTRVDRPEPGQAGRRPERQPAPRERLRANDGEPRGAGGRLRRLRPGLRGWGREHEPLPDGLRHEGAAAELGRALHPGPAKALRRDDRG